jgi:hypothetical protein
MSIPNPINYPIHITHESSLYLCRKNMVIIPTGFATDDKWNAQRPLCKKCNNIHFVKTGEIIKWPKQ